jgi:hypothetical protein
MGRIAPPVLGAILVTGAIGLTTFAPVAPLVTSKIGR